MVKDLHLPVRIVAAPTVREHDGLALSSRNQYLSPEERAQAPILQEALQSAAQAVRSGETRSDRIKRILLKNLSRAPLARPDYVEIVDAETLLPVRSISRNCVLALAVFFGKTRLIDNLWLR
jgi:pantoate--beta-alanine ligase